MDDNHEKKLLIELYSLKGEIVEEYDKGIKHTLKHIENEKEINSIFNQAKEKEEIGRKIIADILESPNNSVKSLSSSEFRMLQDSLIDTQDNLNQIKLVNTQRYNDSILVASTAATATTLSSGSDSSGNTLFSIYGTSLTPTTHKEIDSSFQTTMYDKIGIIEENIRTLNPEIEGSFSLFMREWKSLSQLDQKIPRVLDLRTNVYNGIFYHNCDRKKIQDAQWYKNQIFQSKKDDKNLYFCILFFILKNNGGMNLPQHTINAIQSTVDRLVLKYNQMSAVGKKRHKKGQKVDNSVLEKIVEDTISGLFDCIQMRDFIGRSEYIFIS